MIISCRDTPPIPGFDPNEYEYSEERESPKYVVEDD